MVRYSLGPQSRRVYDALRRDILDGVHAPGTRLPSHEELAARFEVAPLTLRQALAELEQEGLLSREQGRGTFVRLWPKGRPPASISSLRERERRFQCTVDQAPVGIAHNAPDGSWIYVNPRLLEMYGYTKEELFARDWQTITHPDDVGDDMTQLQRLLAGQISSYSLEKRYMRKDGSSLWAQVSISLVRDAAGSPMYTIGIIEDIGPRKRAEQALLESETRLRHQALHDGLTALPNRALLQDRLEQALTLAQRNRGPVSLLLMDLDRFKEINDTFGHHYGDLVLHEVGQRLRGVLRESDTVARLGGDEFAVLLPEADAAGGALVAEKILESLRQPFLLESHTFAIGASIGITSYPAHGEGGATLLQRADVAMYVAKRGRSGHATYDPEEDDYSPMRLALISELRRAIEESRLVLHYQPKVRLATGEVEGVEALVRWRHPERGLISPDQLVPLAEQTGLITGLGDWVLGEALEQCRLWHDRGLRVGVAVNLSARNLHDPNLATTLSSLLRRWELEPSWLELELAESTVMEDRLRAETMLARLHELGVRISIDDFGTGYSSLAYLRRLPVDQIKIDKSFVLDMPVNESNRSIVRATIGLAHDLGLRAIAEGVEHETVWKLLCALGCDVAQGYWLSPPLSSQECTEWLVARRIRAVS